MPIPPKTYILPKYSAINSQVEDDPHGDFIHIDDIINLLNSMKTQFNIDPHTIDKVIDNIHN